MRCFASARPVEQRQVGTLLSCLWYPTKAEKSVACTNHDRHCGLPLLSGDGALLYFAGGALPVSESAGWPKGGVEFGVLSFKADRSVSLCLPFVLLHRGRLDGSKVWLEQT